MLQKHLQLPPVPPQPDLTVIRVMYMAYTQAICLFWTAVLTTIVSLSTVGELNEKLHLGERIPWPPQQNMQPPLLPPKCKCLIGEKPKTPFGRTCPLSTPGEDAAPLTPLNGSAKTAPRFYGG